MNFPEAQDLLKTDWLIITKRLKHHSKRLRFTDGIIRTSYANTFGEEAKST